MSDNDDRKGIERLVEFEYARLAAIDNSKGWSEWVLVAGVGGLAWSALPGLFDPTTRIGIVWLEVVILVALLRACRWVTVTLLAQPTDQGGDRRFFSSTSLLSPRVGALFADALYAASVLAFLVWCPESRWFGSEARVLLSVAYGVGTFIYSAFIAGAALQFPLPVSPPRGRYSWIGDLFGGLLAIPAAVAVSAGEVFAYGSSSEAKVAALVVANLFLIRKWLERAGPNPVVAGLAQLRQDIGLEVEGVDGARRRFEILIRGARLSDLLVREIDQVMAASTDLASALSGQFAKATQVRAVVEELEPGQDADKASRVDQEFDELERELNGDTALIDRVDKAGIQLIKRLEWVVKLYPWVREDANEVSGLLRGQLKAIQAAVDSLRVEMLHLKSSVQRL